MFGVGISLGFSSAYVAVCPISPSIALSDDLYLPNVNIVANSSGHRNTPPVCAFTESSEILFGDTAHHSYARQPGQVVPSVFAYAAVEHALASSNGEETEYSFHEAVDRSSSVKYKGHKKLTEAEKGWGFPHDFCDSNGNELSRIISAKDLFVHLLNHIKEHSVDGPCSLNAGEKEKNKIFLTVVVPRYAFPSCVRYQNPRSGPHGSPWEWVQAAVKNSNFSDVVTHTNVIFSDEAVLLGLDGLNRNNPNYRQFLMPRGNPNESESPDDTDSPDGVLVVDWGSQGLHFTLLHIKDGMLVDGVHPFAPYFSTLFHQDIASCGGDALDVILADRVAANFMLQQRRIFQSKVPQFMSAMQPKKEVLGKSNPVVQEHIPMRALRQLRLKTEEKKMSLLSNSQVAAVSVEAEAFYDGMDLLDNQTLSRRRLELGLTSEWGLVEIFQMALERFLDSDDVRQELRDRGIGRAVLCGGMCQIPFLTNLLEKSLQSILIQSSSSRGPIDVVAVCKMSGSVSADEIFAVGGSTQSFYTGVVWSSTGSAEAALKSQGRRVNQSSTRSVLAETLQSIWIVLGGKTKGNNPKISPPAPSSPFLSHNIYLYTDADCSPLSEYDSETGTIDLLKSTLTTVFSAMSSLPRRITIEWPDEECSTVVLYFFADDMRSVSKDFTGEPMTTRRVFPLTQEGISLSRPAGTLDESSVLIVLTALMDKGAPSLKVQVAKVKKGGRTLGSSNMLSTISIPL